MSFLQSGLIEANSCDMRKAVISLWVRVPQETIDAVHARDAAYPELGALDMLGNVAPFIMFGGQPAARHWRTDSDAIIGYDYSGPQLPFNNPPAPFYSSYPVETAAYHQPSCIGVWCGGDTPKLHFRLQMGNAASCSSTSSGAQSVTPIGTTPSELGDFTFYDPVYEDTSFSDQVLETAYIGNSGAEASGPDIAPDVWHHVLMSWDVSAGNSVRGRDIADGDIQFKEYFTKTSKLYCAVDDVNKNNGKLPAFLIDPSIPNDTVITTCSDHGGANQIQIGPFPTATYPSSSVTFTPSGIPVNPIWLPGPALLKRSNQAGASTDLTDANQNIELAELQIFTGITIDTADAASRRLFITKDGKPELDYSEVDRVLGQPKVRLHGSGNWKRGKNTGSLKTDFEPTGKIEKYTPNPSLYGPQSPK
jgi:hypothetical protein